MKPKHNLERRCLRHKESPFKLIKMEPIAVLLSLEEYQCIEELKLKLIKERALRAKNDFEQGRLLDGQTVFNRLISNDVKVNNGC